MFDGAALCVVKLSQRRSGREEAGRGEMIVGYTTADRRVRLGSRRRGFHLETSTPARARFARRDVMDMVYDLSAEGSCGSVAGFARPDGNRLRCVRDGGPPLKSLLSRVKRASAW